MMIPANPARAERDRELDVCPECGLRYNEANGHACAPMTKKQLKQQRGA